MCALYTSYARFLHLRVLILTPSTECVPFQSADSNNLSTEWYIPKSVDRCIDDQQKYILCSDRVTITVNHGELNILHIQE